MKFNAFKIMGIIFILASQIIFPQTFFHPGRFGFGYNYSFSSTSKFDIHTNTLYGSTGSGELYLTYSKDTKNNIDVGGFGFNFYILRENKHFYPSFSAAVTSTTGAVGLGIGTSIAVDIYRESFFHVIPEFGGGLTLTNNNNDEWKPDGFGHVDFNFGIYIGKYVIFAVTPGYTLSSPNSYSSLSGGIIIALGSVSKE